MNENTTEAYQQPESFFRIIYESLKKPPETGVIELKQDLVTEAHTRALDNFYSLMR